MIHTSVKIKISYQDPEELQKVVNCLQPLGITLKIVKRQEGQFKNAYINIHSERSQNDKCK